MKITHTFAVVEESLYSVKYDTEAAHEFAICFELWNDPVYLREFFELHRKDLEDPFWKGITIEEAILKTREDAKQFEQKLLEIAERGKTEKFETLSTLFSPLSTGVIEDYEKDKAKGMIRPSWLRIYAIRVEANLFVVSGGAIKLTPKMNNRNHLNLELQKLEITRKYLLDDNNDLLDFVELR